MQAIAAHDTHGVDVVVALLLTEHVPSDLVLRMRVCIVQRCVLYVYPQYEFSMYIYIRLKALCGDSAAGDDGKPAHA